MGRRVAPKKFVVGEVVNYFHGEDRRQVTVTFVDGDNVTAKVGPFRQVVFVPRADGAHVAVGSRDTDIMPDMIARRDVKTPDPKPVTLWQRITGNLPGY